MLVLATINLQIEPLRCHLLSLGCGHEAARVHHGSRQRDGRMAAGRAGAATRTLQENRDANALRSGRSGESDAGLDAVRQGLLQLGWSEDRNLSLDLRWLGSDPEGTARERAEELAKRNPDVIFVATTVALRAITRLTSTIPIVFAAVADPVGSGFIPNLPRPGGNVTGFSYLEPRIAGKWVELLKEMAPATRRALFVYDPQTGPFGKTFLHAFEASSRTLDLTQIDASVRGLTDVEKTMAIADDSPERCVTFSPPQRDSHPGGALPTTCGLLQPRMGGIRRTDIIRTGNHRHLSTRLRVHRPHPSWRTPE